MWIDSVHISCPSRNVLKMVLVTVSIRRQSQSWSWNKTSGLQSQRMHSSYPLEPPVKTSIKSRGFDSLLVTLNDDCYWNDDESYDQ